MFDKKDATAQMLKDLLEKQASTITKLDILHRRLVDSDENLTFRYSAILNTLVKILDRLDAAQRKQDNEGFYVGGPRVPGAYFVERVPEQIPPPKEPRLCETFVQFMAEPVENRAYIYYYLLGEQPETVPPERRKCYDLYHVALYDFPAFAELLRETPVRCIL